MLQLLRTKISVPPARPRRVDRARLQARIDRGAQRALTLVVAPAGFGKTTLAAAWAQSTEMPVAWLSLEPADCAPERFLNYLIHSIQQIAPQTGGTSLALLHSGRAISEEGILYSLVNDFSEIPHELMLILDDYHSVNSSQVNKILQFLLEHRPENFHLCLISRTIPDLHLARLRALDQVTEISAADLRFNPEEIRLFVEQVMDIYISAQELARLDQSMEGWAVGLQLAALARSHLPAEWEIPTGEAHIFEYLAEEVLRCESHQVQDFLMRTALFDRFSAPLCEDLFGPAFPVPELLTYVERSNLFLIPLDSSGTWFRYHALFAEFLRQQMAQRAPQQVSSLYRKASLWFESNGIFDDAIHYATHAGDSERAADMIEASYRDMLQRGEQSALLEWLSDLPPGLVEQRPRLLIAKGWANIIALDAQGALTCADQAEALVPEGEPGSKLRGELIALRVLTGIFQGQVHVTGEISKAFILLSEQDDFLHSILHFNLGLSSVLLGETYQAVEAFTETVQLTKKLNNPLVTIVAFTQLGETHQVRGELALAERAFQQAIRYAQHTLGRHTLLQGMPYVSYAELLREQNRFEEAIRYAEQGIAYCLVWQPMASMDGYLALARLEAGRRDWQAAFARFDQAIQTAERTSTFLDDTFVNVFRARGSLLQGNLSQALQWMRVYQADKTAGMFFTLREMANLVMMRANLLQGQDVSGELAELMPEFERRERVTPHIESLVLRAYALQNNGKPQEAGHSLNQALNLGVKGGYVRIFADEGKALLDLLEKHRDRLTVPPAYLENLLTIMRREAGSTPLAPSGPATAPDVASRSEGLISLTRRELDVLRLLAEGKTNQEIADDLVLALNTVKKHVANILGKLGVANRTQAVMVAKEKDWTN
jgi:LuxR family transcriptional regulator, maltose regulon positive regulatory protein